MKGAKKNPPLSAGEFFNFPIDPSGDRADQNATSLNAFRTEATDPIGTIGTS
jgi:hypothetical protein